ncbi:MAG: ThiF family adenylyltransferase [Polyangiaceae bacterium]|nr:ThiF family adenylyltransferase [Polyangiaceae bacterium]
MVERISEAPNPLAEGILETAVGPRRYRLHWPPDFPLRPPIVWELSADGTRVVDYRPYGHSFADLSICLFAHSPEHGWNADLSAAVALDRLRAFIEASDRSEFPRVENRSTEIKAVRVSVHPQIAAAMREGGRWGVAEGYFRNYNRLFLITRVEETRTSGLVAGFIDKEPPPAWRLAMGLAQRVHCLWCRVNEEPENFLSSREQLINRLLRDLDHPKARDLFPSAPVVLLVHNDALWFVYLNPPEPLNAMLKQCGVSLLYAQASEEVISQKIFMRVDECLAQRDHLRRARVAIVGLGSLGSTVALTLAKAGVYRFTLIDPEPLEPENIARHVGGVIEIGNFKVDAVARAILRVNPDAEIIPVPALLSLDPEGWALDPMRHLLEVVRDPTGVSVCTTATTDAERLVNAVAVTENGPAIFAAVLGRAEHGRIFRVLPGKTPCYQCVLLAQAANPGRFPRFNPADIGVPGYHAPGIPGLGMDVDQVALLTARLTLQTLGERIPGGIGYPPANGDHFLWSNHGGWAVDGPLQVRIERIERQPECPVCGEPQVSALSSREEEELRSLLGPREK